MEVLTQTTLHFLLNRWLWILVSLWHFILCAREWAFSELPASSVCVGTIALWALPRWFPSTDSLLSIIGVYLDKHAHTQRSDKNATVSRIDFSPDHSSAPVSYQDIILFPIASLVKDPISSEELAEYFLFSQRASFVYYRKLYRSQVTMSFTPCYLS